MPVSTLPPIGWGARCGHWNEVRSDLGGFKVACKVCGADIWCPKRKAGRPRTGRRGPARVNGKPAVVIAHTQPQPASRPVQQQPPVQNAGPGKVTIRGVITQLTGASNPGAVAGMGRAAGYARAWCRRCGAMADPDRPDICPCGRPDWISQAQGRIANR